MPSVQRRQLRQRARQVQITLSGLNRRTCHCGDSVVVARNRGSNGGAAPAEEQEEGLMAEQ